MAFPFVKKQTPQAHTWELLAQTQSEVCDLTSLLFINELGDFKTIELTGMVDQSIDHYLKFFAQTGLQSVTVDKGGKKLMIVQIPESKLPAKNVQPAPGQEGVSAYKATPNMAVKP